MTGRRDDSGFTLIELMVTILILGIVVAAVSTLLVNSFFVQTRVVGTTYSSSDTQTAASSITYDLRYAQEVRVTGDSLLRTRTWVGEDGVNGQYVCRGWFYDNGQGVLRRATERSQTQGATATSASTWPIFVEGISASKAFEIVADGTKVTFVGEPDSAGVPTGMDATVASRKQIPSEEPACF